MSVAIAGHGALIAVEQDPAGMQAVFTTIAELNSDFGQPEVSRGEAEATPHNDKIDTWVLGVLRRSPLVFSVNFIFDDVTHDHLTGLYNALDENETRGWQIRGPSGLALSDEWIMSGAVQALAPTNPVREGVRTMDVTVRMSGVMLIDGVAFPT